MNELRKKIMKRVYWLFALRLAAHPITVHSVILGVGIFALTKIVSIPDVWANMMEVKVGEVAYFFIGAFLNTQAATIVWLTIVTITMLSLLWRLLKGHNFNLGRKTEWA